MKNLTTRKIVLGMLMTLVLAFSVQGIAEAVTISEITNATPGDLGRLVAGGNFDISFTLTEGTDDATTDNVVEYDQESVNITVSGAGARITSLTGVPNISTTSHTFSENPNDAPTTNDNLPSGTITATITTSSAGELTVTISDRTSSSDTGGKPCGRNSGSYDLRSAS